MKTPLLDEVIAAHSVVTKEEIVAATSKKRQLLTDTNCPNCSKPMKELAGDGLPMLACLSCRCALPGRTNENVA